MTKQSQTSQAQVETKSRPKPKPATVPDQSAGQALVAGLPVGPIGAVDNPSIQRQADRLNDPRLSEAQRQAMARQIGRGQGNRHLKMVMATLSQRQPGNGSASNGRTHKPAAPHLRTGPGIQPKLTVNEPDDQYEQEAEQTADAVMRMAASAPLSPPDGEDGSPNGRSGLPAGLADLPADLSGEAPQLQTSRDEATDLSPALETRIGDLQGGGSPLAENERAFFEARLGSDFSDVRVHTGDEAAQTSRDLNARAYTIGSDIVFNEGEFRPGSEEGRHLLAHELTHVVQQGAAGDIQRQEGEEDDTPTEEEKAAALAAAAAAEGVASTAKTEGEGKTAQSKAAGESKKAEGEGAKATVEGAKGAGPVTKGGAKAKEAALAEKAKASQSESKARQAAAEESAQAAAQAAVDSIDAPASEQSAAAAAQAAETAGAAGGGSGSGIEGATPAAKSAVEEAYGAAESPEGKAPASPAEDPAYQAVEEGTKVAGRSQQTHDPAKDKADEAQAAVESPASEIMGEAQTGQVGEMEQTEPPAFDAAGFKQQLMERIAAMTPQSVEEADNFKAENNLDEAKGEMTGKVEQEREASQGPLEEKTTEAPDTGSVEPKPVTEREPAEPGEAPPEIGAEAAVPKPKSPAEFEKPLQESSKSVDDQMKDADISDEQLAESNEPEFQSALDAKEEAKAQAEQTPQEYRQFEESQLSQAEAEAAGAAQEALQSMHDERVSSAGQVEEDQNQAQSEDEQARAQVGVEINAIFERTKANVEGILSRLDGEVERAFDSGAEEARQAFEDYVTSKMEAYKQKRYGGWLGWAKWAKDKLLGMPSEVNAFYTEGRQLYLQKMDAVIDNVVSIIGTTLAEAKAEIANGKQEIQAYVEQLPDDLQGVGQEAAQSVESRFEALEESVDNKQNELIDTLANKYQENLEALDSRIEELKAANRGLVDMVIDAIAGVIKVILKLKDLLMSVLSGVADAVSAIIKDPIGFIGNLFDAVKQGLNNFVSRIGEHLQTGFVEWLTGTMGEAGIQMPEDIFSLEGILDLVLQILGLTWENFRARAVAIFGETVVSALETGFEIFIILKEEGLPGVWEWIQEKLADLKDQVIEGIKDMLISEVVEAGIKWIVGLLGGPAGAFIKACMAIYDIVMWFVNNAERLASLIRSISDSIVAIASGSLSAAAEYVENALANFIPTAIGFLASLLGLGDLSTKVRKIIDKVQAPVNEAIDYVLNLIKRFVMKIAKMLGFGDGGGAEGGEIGKEVSFSVAEESHRVFVDVQGSSATLMWAADGELPLADKLNGVSAAVGQMTGEQQGEAQGLLSQAQSQESEASEKARNLAAKKDEVKTMDDGDTISQEQDSLEADIDALAGVLPQLFEMAGDEGSNEVKAKVREELASRVSGPIENFEEIQTIVTSIFGQFQEEGLKSLEVEPSSSRPGTFEILAAASAKEVSGQVEAALGINLRDLDLSYGTTLTADLLVLNGNDVENRIPLGEHRAGDGLHAEEHLLYDLDDDWNSYLDEIFESVQQRPVNCLLSISITRTPCENCSRLLRSFISEKSQDQLELGLSLRAMSMHGGVSSLGKPLNQRSFIGLQELASGENVAIEVWDVLKILEEDGVDLEEMDEDTKSELSRRANELNGQLARIDEIEVGSPA